MATGKTLQPHNIRTSRIVLGNNTGSSLMLPYHNSHHPSDRTHQREVKQALGEVPGMMMATPTEPSTTPSTVAAQPNATQTQCAAQQPNAQSRHTLLLQGRTHEERSNEAVLSAVCIITQFISTGFVHVGLKNSSSLKFLHV